jgi:hypothetical protein
VLGSIVPVWIDETYGMLRLNLFVILIQITNHLYSPLPGGVVCDHGFVVGMNGGYLR